MGKLLTVLMCGTLLLAACSDDKAAVVDFDGIHPASIASLQGSWRSNCRADLIAGTSDIETITFVADIATSEWLDYSASTDCTGTPTSSSSTFTVTIGASVAVTGGSAAKVLLSTGGVSLPTLIGIEGGVFYHGDPAAPTDAAGYPTDVDLADPYAKLP